MKPHDAYFRLLELVLDEFRRGIATEEASDAVPPGAHRSLIDFPLWSLRLSGGLPPLDRCIESNEHFADGQPAFISLELDGLFSSSFKDSGWCILPTQGGALALALLGGHLGQLGRVARPATAATDLPRFLLQRIESQRADRLRVAGSLAALCAIPSYRRASPHFS